MEQKRDEIWNLLWSHDKILKRVLMAQSCLDDAFVKVLAANITRFFFRRGCCGETRGDIGLIIGFVDNGNVYFVAYNSLEVELKKCREVFFYEDGVKLIVSDQFNRII